MRDNERRDRRERGGKKKKKRMCCDVWRGWFEVALNTPSICLSLLVLSLRSRCWGGLGEGSGEHSAVSVPASRAEPGLLLQGLPLLWQVLPHLPSSQSPSADTHRSVHPKISILRCIDCISPAIKHLLYFM